ncbi:hydrolase [Marinobacterium rhizophilum]|uniref:Hydrolase n=1 Tax=Marinobacterium rhizophilum TaxID=420402 RepID=A0ABY5HNF9_9GAMM|nr:hydrolase [Marinobacterium rhizophilum]UTW13484.1 hydrolase [Marinobacterium rhizophilum]
MLIHPDKSLLLVIDVQDKLLPAVAEPEPLLENCRWLLEIADYLKVPVLGTEQYPQGIGHTAEPLGALIPAGAMLEKTHFSCVAEPACAAAIEACQPQQVVIIGIEAHVCVLQSALQLREQARDVFVVADCIASRNPQDKALAIERMRQAGIQVVSREMVAFEWMRKAGTDSFRHISRNYLR